MKKLQESGTYSTKVMKPFYKLEKGKEWEDINSVPAWLQPLVWDKWNSLAGKTFEEIELFAAQGRLSEEGMKYYEALKKAKEEGEDLAKRQEDFLEEVRKTFTGTTSDSIVNSIVDGFKAGKRSAADFADTFEELMQGAVASALQMAADDKTRKFYEEFANRTNDDDGLTQSDIHYLNDLWDNIIDGLAKESERLEQVTGMRLGDKGNASLSGSIRSLTEETGSTIAGQFNAMRIIQADMALLQQRQFDEQINLVDLSRQTVTVLRDSLLYHRETAQNTAVLHELTAVVKGIANKQSLPDTDPYRALGL